MVGTFVDVKPADVYWAVSESTGWTRLLAARDALDAGERARAERFAFAPDREAFVAAHVLLRLVLSAHANVAASDWQFAANSSGKPEVAGPNRALGVTFSLSHARTIVACAVTREGAVGVDVEAIAADDADGPLLDYAFGPAERTFLASCEPAVRRVAFARLWTLKEAVMKAAGGGELGAIECGLEPPRLLRGPLGDDAAAWELTSLMPTERHALGLARAAGPSIGAVVREVVLGEP